MGDSEKEQAWPLPSLNHVRRMTDDCGMIQHAKFWLPDYSTGYCVDDNSRALIVAMRSYRLQNSEQAHELMVRYLSLLFYAQRPDGKMRNFIDYSRRFLEKEGSPDSQGRAVWALGTLSTLDEAYLSVPAQEMFHRAIRHITPNSPPHTLAYTTLGISAFGSTDEFRAQAQGIIRPVARALLARYVNARDDGWEWFLPILTYANGRLPQALLQAGLFLGDGEFIDAGLRSLDFLNDICYPEGYLAPIGCHGWYPRNGVRALYDQQPIDAGCMVEANLLSYRITHLKRYWRYAALAMDWFFGSNSLGLPVHCAESGGCHDGLHQEGVNLNQGAESTIAMLMAQLHMYEFAPQKFSRPVE